MPTVVVLSDSVCAINSVRRILHGADAGPTHVSAGVRARVAADVRYLKSHGVAVQLHWVPGHAGVAGEPARGQPGDPTPPPPPSGRLLTHILDPGDAGTYVAANSTSTMTTAAQWRLRVVQDAMEYMVGGGGGSSTAVRVKDLQPIVASCLALAKMAPKYDHRAGRKKRKRDENDDDCDDAARKPSQRRRILIPIVR
ncbi:hypothetical protein F4780DRAFT_776294 [Xylariomycetidae sp. FL0641]|nr:hypothetical protein F4780DRAFT_776294 [Xylariomycetidae sp. FL0641]